MGRIREKEACNHECLHGQLAAEGAGGDDWPKGRGRRPTDTEGCQGTGEKQEVAFTEEALEFNRPGKPVPKWLPDLPGASSIPTMWPQWDKGPWETLSLPCFRARLLQGREHHAARG